MARRDRSKKRARTKFVVKMRWIFAALTAAIGLGLIAYRLHTEHARKEFLEAQYPKIERLMAFYSLALWKDSKQERPTVSQSIHAESEVLNLQFPDVTDTNSEPSRSILFDSFQLPRVRRFEGEEVPGEQIPDGWDWRSEFEWRSVFGYQMNVTVELDDLADLRDSLVAEQNRLLEEERFEDRNIFRFYEIHARLPSVGENRNRSYTYLVSDGYLFFHNDGSITPKREWIWYDENGSYITLPQLESLIVTLLREMGITESDVSKVAARLEVEWLQRNERMVGAIIDAVRDLPEGSNAEKFLDLADPRK